MSDPEVRRWYDNVARGSVITADVYLRRPGLFCENNSTTPKILGEKDETSLTALTLDNVTRLGAENHAGSYIESIVKAVKSWLQHNNKQLKGNVRITDAAYKIRDAIRAAGFSRCPYVLRCYFDSQILFAESKHFIIRDYRVFWVGHKGDNFLFSLFAWREGLPLQ